MLNDRVYVEVVGVTEAAGASKMLQLLLADDTEVHVEPELWRPYEGLVEKGDFYVYLKLCGDHVKEISLTEE